ncbi:MAG: sulfatase [Bryobacteraceae bacterium]|nr:sulfatase [Bryobacteraceae bacterium]MDW8377313.1 sulfatase [Bryobacterales bacterium]
MTRMNRRQALGATIGFPAVLRGQRNDRRNVLFIAVDDLNDWIGCMGGHPDTKTPNFDRLAARGVLFTRAYCAAPLCNPSRAALMTGLRPSTMGVYDNSQPFRRSKAKDAVTLAQHFRANGYRSLGAGKIFHGPFPDPPSWDDYWPQTGRPRPEHPKPEKIPANGIPQAGPFDWAALKIPDQQMYDYQVVDWVIHQLRQKQEKPFFLACGLFRPHLPWYVPEKYFDLFPLEKITLPSVKDDDLEDIPPLGKRMANPEGDHAAIRKYNQYRQAVQAYLASIAFADAQLGRLLEALDQSAYRENTNIVLWSDHGWHLGEKLHWRKFALWEEATHNVLMICAPGVTPAGGRCPRTVNLLDIYPTLVELHALPKVSGLEGVSLVPLLKDPNASWSRPSLTTYGRNNHSVRSERFRYIRYRDQTEELYDHQTDDLEWHNLASDPRYAVVKRELARWLPDINEPDSIRVRAVE